MKKISVALVDDQPGEVTLLKQLLMQDDRFKIAGELSDAQQLEPHLQHQPVDLIFTDIHMPGLDDISVIKSSSSTPKVVFLASYPKSEIDRFDYQPLYLLTKPLEEEKVLRCLEVAYENLTGQLDTNPYIFIKINQDKLFQKVYLHDIIYIESVGEYQKFHLASGEKLLTYKRLKDIVEELPEPCFKQIHRSYAINFHHLKSLLTDQVVLTDDIMIPVSRSNRKSLIQSFEEFVNSHRSK